ncbi:MAG: hypothetical protein WA003_09650 [Desulfuromonadaceae bacterium]
MTDLDRAKEVIGELLNKIVVLEQTVVSLSGADSPKKMELLTKVIKAHPDCYSQIEFDEAFKEESEKPEYRNHK